MEWYLSPLKSPGCPITVAQAQTGEDVSNMIGYQAMRPAGEIEYRPTPRWTFNANLAFTRGEGFHAYDNMQSGFFISYLKPLRQAARDAIGVVPVEYPIRFSVGLQQQQFMNLTGRGQAIFRPVFRLTLF